MALFAPHYNLFRIIGYLRTALSVIFWGIFIISVIPAILTKLNLSISIDSLINAINIVLILSYFFIDILIDYILIPMADGKRRDDFLDNSFGSTLSIQSSVGYYDNDEVSFSLYKAAVNLFQNCFTTHSLVKRITVRKTMLLVFIFIIIVILAYTGFKTAPFALSILQALFSATILGGLIKHFVLLTRLNAIENNWVGLFSDPAFKDNTDAFKHKVYKYWFAYETLHSKIPAEIPKKVYDNLNPTLTDEWMQMKTRYNIN